MGCDVFANSNEIACKEGGNKVIAEFPDVCLSPPSPPAGPVPVPYPDTSFSKDMQSGSKTVQIKGGEIMLKDQSFYKTAPLGDEAATNGLGANVITHVITGKTYFVAWSMDVQFEGQNVDRHLDLTTSNHNPEPGGTGPTGPSTAISSPTKYKNQTCSDERREELHKEQKDIEKTMVKDENCSPSTRPKELARLNGIPCSRVKERRKNQEALLAKRKQMKKECFDKPPDPNDPEQVKAVKGHDQAITDVETGLGHTKNRENINCAPGHPMAKL